MKNTFNRYHNLKQTLDQVVKGYLFFCYIFFFKVFFYLKIY